MCKRILSLVLFAALLPLAGCGGQNAESLIQEQIAQLNSYADALESGADETQLESIQGQMEKTKTALDNLKLSDEEKQKLGDKYGKQLTEAAQRVMLAGRKKMGGMMQGAKKRMPVPTPGSPDGMPKSPK